MRVVERHAELALAHGRELGQKVRRDAFEPFLGRIQGRLVFLDVVSEVEFQARKPLLERLELVLLVGRQVQPVAPELEQHVGQEPLILTGQRLSLGRVLLHRTEHVLAALEVYEELIRNLLDFEGPVAHGRIRRDLGEEGDRSHHRGVIRERVLHRRHRIVESAILGGPGRHAAQREEEPRLAFGQDARHALGLDAEVRKVRRPGG